MKGFQCCAVALILVSTATTRSCAQSSRRLVLFDQSNSDSRATLGALLDSLGGNNRKVWYKFSGSVLGFAADFSDEEAGRLRARSGVREVLRDAVVGVHPLVRAASVATTSPTWGRDTVSFNSGITPAAGDGGTVYLLDSGVREAHKELGGRARLLRDFMGDDNENGDCFGHGTHVAGLIVGQSSGIAPGARVNVLRVLDCDGYGTPSSVLKALEWVHDSGTAPAVVNLPLSLEIASIEIDAAVYRLINRGFVVVAAAGNDGMMPCKRAIVRVPGVVVIGAHNEKHSVPSFSNWGPCLSVFAPGTDVVGPASNSDDGMRVMSGTSQASAFAAGVAVDLLSRYGAAVVSTSADSLRTAATLDVIVPIGKSANSQFGPSLRKRKEWQRQPN